MNLVSKSRKVVHQNHGTVFWAESRSYKKHLDSVLLHLDFHTISRVAIGIVNKITANVKCRHIVKSMQGYLRGKSYLQV